MTEKIKFTEHDRLFYSDGYQLGQSAAQGGLTTQKLFEAQKTLYQSIDGLIDSLLMLAKKQEIDVACHKGCFWCCHQAVYANSFEIHYLTDHILKNFSKEKQKQILSIATAKNNRTNQLSANDVLKYKSPCPLLENGACLAYEARPMACRIYLSTKLPSCQEFFHHPENKKNYPALMDFPLRTGRMMNEGFRAALKENGIEPAELRLEEGLVSALTNPEIANAQINKK